MEKVYKVTTQGNFECEHVCQECPETGKYLYPLLYTHLEPPAIQEFEVLHFDGLKWNINKTNKGKTIYSKENYLLSTICITDELPPDATLEKPLDYPCKWSVTGWVEDLEKIRENKTFEIAQAFERTFSKGFFFSEELQINVDCRRYGKDNDSQNIERLIKNLTKNGLLATPVFYGYKEEKAYDVSIVSLKALLDEMDDYVLLNYNKKWSLEEQLKTAFTKEQINDVNW